MPSTEKSLKEQITAIADEIRKYSPWKGGSQKFYLPGVDGGQGPSMIHGISGAVGATSSKEYQRGVTDGTAAGYNQGHEEGYNHGMDAQKYQWWYKYLTNSDGSVRTDYAYAFYGTGWNNYTFTPTQNLTVLTGTSMFYQSRIEGSLSNILGNVSIDFSNCTTAPSCFSSTRFSSLPALNMQNAGNLSNFFKDSSRLTSVDLFSVNKNALLTRAFEYCPALENITFGGTIAKSMDIHWSTKLSTASIKSLLGVLTETVTGVTITLPVTVNGQDTLTLLQTDTELAPLYTAAIEKGYSIAFA